MKIIYCSKTEDSEQWRKALSEAFTPLNFCIWPDIGNPDEPCYALVWKPPHGWHRLLPGLKAILTLGAGVDALLGDSELPHDIPVTRLVDAGMGRQMAEYAAYGVMHFHRRMHEYSLFQKNSVWQPLEPVPSNNFPVGIMGLGVLGTQVANFLVNMGYPVLSWSLSKKNVAGIVSYAGEKELDIFLSKVKVLINLLPLTQATTGIINKKLINNLPYGAFIINLARGKHIVESDLLSALDSGRISGAMLDVFEHEPLPPEHPFWNHRKILITPHIAALTIPEYAVEQIIGNIRSIEAGHTPSGLVNLKKGY